MSLAAVQAAHWAVALTPVLVLLGIFLWLDAFKLMSFGEVVLLLFAGGIGVGIASPIAGRFLDALPIGFSNYSRFVAPWIEEAIKCAIMILLFRLNRVGYKVDAVISGFAIGAGFSVVENVIYLIRFPDYGTGTWLVRGVGTAVMHGTTLAILAAIAHELAERENQEAAGDFDFRLWWFLPGYLIAVALHTAFNQFPDRPLAAMLGAIIFAPIALVGIFYFGTVEAERCLVSERGEHRSQIETLRAGRWPDSAAGRKVAALAARVGPEGAKRIRRYWELHAWLVAEAEETMIEKAEGGTQFDAAEIRATLAELTGLKRALGRSTFIALNALLPFSRNDYWEVSELKQRLGRE
jgi:RsiW-degrading membrane proteinase PrsW (M82 family)